MASDDEISQETSGDHAPRENASPKHENSAIGDQPPRTANILYAPWRMDYIRALARPPSAAALTTASAAGVSRAADCFICDAAAADAEPAAREALVLWKTPQSVVLINRYPYTNGHLLVAPRSHKADLEELSDPELLDMQLQTIAAMRLLKRAISAQGFNVGINFGRCAGAGVPGHVHQHIVPRWAGDVNFMGVVADVRVVPQTMSQLHDELLRVLAGART